MAKIARAVLRNPNRPELDARAKENVSVILDSEREVTTLAKAGTPQTVVEYTPVVREYWAPFNYPNFCVELGRTDPYVGAEFNMDGVELDVPPYGAITFVEEEPIVGVTVIGSACIPPGYIELFAEPVEWKYPRTGVKMKVDGLWGDHLRIELWRRGIDERWRSTGLSAAHFSLPESKKITIMGGSQHDICDLDIQNMRHDAHYCIRIIRVTVNRKVGG